MSMHELIMHLARRVGTLEWQMQALRHELKGTHPHMWIATKSPVEHDVDDAEQIRQLGAAMAHAKQNRGEDGRGD